MRRRDLLVLIAGALVIPAAAVGQQAKQHLIAYVATIDPVSELREDSKLESQRAFFSELHRLGYVEGQNIVIERYSVDGHTERHPDLAREVISHNPEVIVTANNYVTRVYKEATSTIPIVSNMGDPVAVGLVASLAHPGGNITGVTGDPGGEIGGKRLQLLKELIPPATKIAVLCMHVMKRSLRSI